jgi:N-acetylneuraminic acid mutarotase
VTGPPGAPGRSFLALACACLTAVSALAEMQVPELPAPVANNAVAQVRIDDHDILVSLMGLGAGKSWKDAIAAANRLTVGDDRWEPLPSVPGPGGRLAGTAAGIGDRVYVFGGYTVASDGSEVSVELVHRLDPVTGEYEELDPMPVPVDDTVSLAYRNRYVYLVSGWHDSGNVNLVQVYDSREDRWFQATPFPGDPVFGHAGGIVGGRLVICDGVGIRTPLAGRRSFGAVSDCFHGTIDEGNPARIVWRRLAHHGGAGMYRMAAAGSSRLGMIVFAGGSDNPYNFNGVGYDGEPSAASARVFAYDLEGDAWQEFGELPQATMDHRGLLEIGDEFLILGGMREGQAVSPGVIRFRLQEQVIDPGSAR